MANEFGNYCTMNFLDASDKMNIRGIGNLTPSSDSQTASGNLGVIRGTLSASSGKWYYEGKVSETDSYLRLVGFLDISEHIAVLGGTTPYVGKTAKGWGIWYDENNNRFQIYNNNSGSNIAGSLNANDILQFALDLDAGKIWFGKNNTWFSSGDPAAGSNPIFTSVAGTLSPAITIKDVDIDPNKLTFNFGATAFAYTPPSGFASWNTANLPTPAAKNYEDEYFLKTGIIHTTGATTAITLPKTVSGGAMVRIKETDATTSWICFDTARGVNKAIFWNLTAAEDSSTYDNQNLTGTTFTMPSDLPSGTYLLECFYVGDYFAILEDEGDGEASRSINHGAGFLPAFIWRKNLEQASYNSVLFHTSVGTGGYLYGSSAAAAITNEGTAGAWAGGTFTTTVIIVGSNNDANKDGENFISYLWADAGPYSFGQYTGNKLADGTFIPLGGSPQLFVAKPIAAADSYLAMYRPFLNYNPSGVRQYWEEPYANSTSTTDGVLDFHSNGVKLRTAGTGNNSTNTNYLTYLYFAFGIQPIQGDDGINQVRSGAVKPFGQAYGGTISVSNSFFIHSFTSTSTFTATKSGNVELLVVAGGGGGCMGGGGAGGYRTAASQSVTAGTAVTVTIGAGGTAGNTNQDGNGGNGGNSSFGSVLVSTGGGGGADNGTATGAAPTGGSGGGLGENSGGNYSIGQGNAGGFSPSEGNNGGDANNSADAYGGGGGGGSSAVGANGTSSAAGAGGAGTANTITGVSVAYAGGGAGGRITGSDASGGNGGGGASGVAGTANTGGGGGGGRGASAGGTNFVAGAGGTGIVIIKYAIG